jgi:RNA polymerase sigma factor for flagellar operon FliA
VDVDDLVQDGLIGLMDAARRFDPARGIAFDTFAYARVRGAMIDNWRRASWPRSIRRARRELAAARVLLRQELGAEPTVTELAMRTGRPVVNVTRLLQRIGHIEQPDPPPPVPTPDVLYAEDETRSRVRRAVAALPARERQVVQAYYFTEMRQARLSAVMGITPGRISQLHTRALGRLRAALTVPPEGLAAVVPPSLD